MSEDTQTNVTDSTEGQDAGSSAETKNTDTNPTGQEDQSVPYARFQEVNQRMRELEGKLSERDDAEKAAEEAKLIADGKLQELLDAKSAELQAAQEEIDILHNAQRTNTISAAIEEAARNAGFANPADAAVFLDVATVDLDDNGKPTGITKSIETLATDRPYLLAAVKPTPGNGTGPKPTGRASKNDEQIQREAAAYVRSRF